MSAAREDPYASAKASVRDNIKWLVAAFASMATAIAAATPFSTLNEHDLLGARFMTAVAGLAFAICAAGFGLVKTLRLLRPDSLSWTDLRQGGPDTAELRKLREYIGAHRVDLLPSNYPTIEALQTAIDAAEDTKQAAEEARNSAAAAESDRVLDQLDAAKLRVLGFALYQRLYQRLVSAEPVILGCGAVVLIGLAVFAVAAKPPKEPAPPLVAQLAFSNALEIVDRRGSASADPRLAPVRFATGSADVKADGLAAISAAREYLRAHPEAVLLLYAYTDTIDRGSINRALSRRRGIAVRKRLLELGGISANRVFVAELPEIDLPQLTEQEASELRNRSVEFRVARIAP